MFGGVFLMSSCLPSNHIGCESSQYQYVKLQTEATMCLENESGYVNRNLDQCGRTKMAITPARTNGYVDQIDHIYDILTFSTWLSWLSWYVNPIFRKPLDVDILAVIVLVQLVHEFDFPQVIER